jgi:hypothetical protein
MECLDEVINIITERDEMADHDVNCIKLADTDKAEDDPTDKIDTSDSKLQIKKIRNNFNSTRRSIFRSRGTTASYTSSKLKSNAKTAISSKISTKNPNSQSRKSSGGFKKKQNDENQMKSDSNDPADEDIAIKGDDSHDHYEQRDFTMTRKQFFDDVTNAWIRSQHNNSISLATESADFSKRNQLERYDVYSNMNHEGSINLIPQSDTPSIKLPDEEVHKKQTAHVLKVIPVIQSTAIDKCIYENTVKYQQEFRRHANHDRLISNQYHDQNSSHLIQGQKDFFSEIDNFNTHDNIFQVIEQQCHEEQEKKIQSRSAITLHDLSSQERHCRPLSSPDTIMNNILVKKVKPKQLKKLKKKTKSVKKLHLSTKLKESKPEKSTEQSVEQQRKHAWNKRLKSILQQESERLFERLLSLLDEKIVARIRKKLEKQEKLRSGLVSVCPPLYMLYIVPI